MSDNYSFLFLDKRINIYRSQSENSVFIGNQTSEQLLDLPAGSGGGELIDDVQSCLVVRIACVYIDARLWVQVHIRQD